MTTKDLLEKALDKLPKGDWKLIECHYKNKLWTIKLEQNGKIKSINIA